MKKLLFDLFPLILFFVAYRYADIYAATAVAMIASVGQLAWLKVRRKMIEGMHWVNLVIILGFGGATLWLQSEVFIMWKPTALYWLFAAALMFGLVFLKRNFLKPFLNAAGKLDLPEPVWTRLAWAWASFFTFMGVTNLVVAFSGWFTEEQWVSFKVFGLVAFMVAFVIGQSIYLARYLQAEDTPDAPDPNPTTPTSKP